MTAVVFLGGPMDGLEMELPGEPFRWHFAQVKKPAGGKPSIDELIKLSDKPIRRPVTVTYQRTKVQRRGKQVYSLVR